MKNTKNFTEILKNYEKDVLLNNKIAAKNFLIQIGCMNKKGNLTKAGKCVFYAIHLGLKPHGI